MRWRGCRATLAGAGLRVAAVRFEPRFCLRLVPTPIEARLSAFTESMNQTASQKADRKTDRKTLQKYIVLQIPGTTMVAFLLAALYYFGTLSGGLAILLMIGWSVKDAVMYRFVRKAYEPGPPHGTEALIGSQAIVVESCEPEGRVRIGAEHWSATPVREGEAIDVGERVLVTAVEGYTVRVERASDVRGR